MEFVYDNVTIFEAWKVASSQLIEFVVVEYWLVVHVTHMGTCGRASLTWPSRVGRRGLLAPRNCDWQPRAARRGA